jgi:hypothetical protein
MTEHEYVYEVGLTPDDKARISRMMGVRTLSLHDYGNALNAIEQLEQDLYFTPHEAEDDNAR